MGQYFKAVNINKREYLEPWCCGDGAKFVEVITGNMPSLITYLLRQSTDSGGGDIEPEDKKLKFVGRWAGDRITLAGDYDGDNEQPNLYDETQNMTNITHDVIEEYNQVVSFDECRVFTAGYHHCELYRRQDEIKEKYQILQGCMDRDGDTAQYYQKEIDKLEAEDEYYGWVEPEWKYQLPKTRKKTRKKGIMAPDMVFTVSKKESDEN